MYAYEVYTHEVYTRNFDLSLTAPMSCRTGRHTTVLGGMRWCAMVPLNGSARAGLWWKRVLKTASQNRHFLLPFHRYRQLFDVNSFYAV